MRKEVERSKKYLTPPLIHIIHHIIYNHLLIELVLIYHSNHQ